MPGTSVERASALATSERENDDHLGAATATWIGLDLASIGCPKLNLQVRGANREAVRFYESLGYSTEDRVSMGRKLRRARDGA